jgi:hypothetical protein
LANFTWWKNFLVPYGRFPCFVARRGTGFFQAAAQMPPEAYVVDYLINNYTPYKKLHRIR